MRVPRAPQAQNPPAPAAAVPVLGRDVRHDVLVEEFQDQGDAVGKHQVLGYVLKLRKRRETGQLGMETSFQPKSTWDALP